MARKPVLFQPRLFTPQGLNNFSGQTFRCFSAGETLPFRFIFKSSDDPDLDVTGWQAKVSFSSRADMLQGLEVAIPLVDVVNRIFEGVVTSAQTKTLVSGLCYVVAKFIDAEGDEYVFDMCILEVYPNPNIPV